MSKSKQRIFFIVNPISGTGKQKQLDNLLKNNLDNSKFTYVIKFTEYGGHATELSHSAIKNNDIIVAVGGDGTVNEVARGLINSNRVMGIIPVGSGNGLARHLKLSMRLSESIKILNKLDIEKIDTAEINGECFVNVAGVGFDAHVAHLYANRSKRGPIPYAKLMTTEFNKYKPVDYKVSIDGESYDLPAFLISFANSSQFGNNAYISPEALINDGLIDVCMMKGFPIVDAGTLAVQLFNKRMNKSKYMRIVRGKNIVIESESKIKGHIDGEPIDFPNRIEVNIKPSSLKIIHNPTQNFFQLPSLKDFLKV